jgi:phosphatidylglycerophosphate synthase
MQALIAIPEFREMAEYEADEALTQDIAGIPALLRVVATAKRAGVDEILLMWPRGLDHTIWEQCIASPILRGLKVIEFPSFAFDPRHKSSWAAIASLLDDEFLWLPWNWITTKQFLAATKLSPVVSAKWAAPVRLTRELALRGLRTGVTRSHHPRGVSVYSPEDVQKAEQFLVANSGKPSDGIYSRINRRLCWPAVRTLTHSPITLNCVTVAGLAVAIVAALMYARGSYLNYLAGALLFFLSGLLDEMDGMLARIKFRESAFGTWFEGFVDNATYLLLFAGITIGLYRELGAREVIYGIALIAGCALSVVVIALQRKTITAGGQPNEYAGRMNRLLEIDPSLISPMVRQIHIFIKKGVAIHYVLIFTVIGALPFFLRLAALAANLTWTLALYFNWKFTSKRSVPAMEQAKLAA